jgi:hypothetical protein
VTLHLFGACVLSFRGTTWREEALLEQRLSLADQRRERMFLIEKKTSPNGQRRAEIYMRPDGLFEGRIYTLESATGRPQPRRREAEFEVCGVTETLPRAQTIVYEELGL